MINRVLVTIDKFFSLIIDASLKPVLMVFLISLLIFISFTLQFSFIDILSWFCFEGLLAPLISGNRLQIC